MADAETEGSNVLTETKVKQMMLPGKLLSLFINPSSLAPALLLVLDFQEKKMRRFPLCL